MPLDIHRFTVHDISRFPLCIVRNDVVVQGYGAQWQAEMAHGVPFVLIYLEPGDDEAHADRKLRSLWLKTHKEAFGHLCISLISVLADEARRAHFDAMGKMGEQAFGIRYETAATQAEGEGEALAQRRIAQYGAA
ncbi:hypothetical protein [Pseudomonas viridiflava]|uniref:hypothetical protein n=1 Tax=Pseudomonas viridiflava TaxID=33069 RepID=UPI000F01431C|nr:hypothetical protein [Pseudomonas viridiflava]